MKVEGGHFRIVAPGSKVMDILKMTHTDSILRIDPTLDAALARIVLRGNPKAFRPKNFPQR